MYIILFNFCIFAAYLFYHTLNYLKMEFTSNEVFGCLRPVLMLPSEALDVNLEYEKTTSNPFEYAGGNVTVTLTVATNHNNNGDKFGIFPEWLNFEPIKTAYLVAEITESELKEILGNDYVRKISNDYEDGDWDVRELKKAVLQGIDLKDIRNSEELRAYIYFGLEKAKWSLMSDEWIKEDEAVKMFHSQIAFTFYKNN